ncbi:glutamate--cysteine ligase [Alteromonas gilva]|uniref:Glutamate--cysteine ligase n=1 Tax=Alteromonas gilva TaxID=2987522 RepID=A0ABT5L3M6_9ALTE|nr:glutamate--cysteine ligase [Alteromonas gilva]MDC8831642.1 glutamate--cysteine ligase [Alteromonas gilva]
MEPTLRPLTHDLSYDLNALKQNGAFASLSAIKRGVERECLRINPEGTLALTPHPKVLGAALTHDSITTDYSESLLEFITPPESDADKTLAQLEDVHKFTVENIGAERLWPLSMPCFIENEADIPIAYFGESNVGKMKKAYRMGLRNRYGSMMQVISGVHFNFSIPNSFWQQLAQQKGVAASQSWVSEQYFGLIRNYRRSCWLIPYLFGASPALCSSFVEGREHGLDFKKLGRGTLYLPYATSLRMSGLGYTSHEQSSLRICYNSLDSYVRLLREAMYTPSQNYAHFAAGEGGNYQQLSKNVLQIENEFYSPIRPKQPTASGEKPTDALALRGVDYIEVRALDVNPFSPIGISREQIDFLDVFLLSCLLTDSPQFDAERYKETDINLNSVVLEGRKPGLMLRQNGQDVAMQDWAEQLFERYATIAELMDQNTGDGRYSAAVKREWQKVLSPDLTYSGRWLNKLLSEGDNAVVGRDLANTYRQQISDFTYHYKNSADFIGEAERSVIAQQEVEAADTVPFNRFIDDYFAREAAKKNA